MHTSQGKPTGRGAIPSAWWMGLVVGVLLLPGAMLMDRELAAAIRPTESAWLMLLAQWGTWLGYGLVDIAVPLLIGLIGRWRFGDGEAWRRGLLGGIAVALAGLANTLAKNVLCRARPSAADAGAFFVGFPCFPASYAQASFPSGHTATAFALATVLSLWYPRWTAAWLALAAVVGWSRVGLGSHFPSDVIAGAVLGSAVVLVLSRLRPRLVKGRQA